MIIKDIKRDEKSLECYPYDITVDKLTNIQVQLDDDCYTLVHPEHLNVYDFVEWTMEHQGGEMHITKCSSNYDINLDGGWYLNYPHDGDVITWYT